METILRITFVVVIGAFIGGLTNFIAIKMLFRPLKPIYIGKWKLPFSPGLIPKRRGEIAAQLGKLVVNYLLTVDMLKDKWKQSNFNEEIINSLTKWVKDFFHSDLSLADYLKEFGSEKTPERINRLFIEKGINELRTIADKHEKRLVKDFLPQQWQDDIQKKIPDLATYITNRIKMFVQSEEGRQILERRMEGMIDGKGVFSNLAKSLIGNLHLADWVQGEIVELMDDHRFQKSIERVLEEEWEKLVSQSIGDLRQKVDEKKFELALSNVLDFRDLLEKPLAELPLTDLERIVTEKVIPQAVEIGAEKFLEALPRLLEKVDIAGLVEDQVNSFSLEELEQLIISFTKRELKMITYLGAYIGGLIGLIQGILMVYF